jgi:hypothetical protein
MVTSCWPIPPEACATGSQTLDAERITYACDCIHSAGVRSRSRLVIFSRPLMRVGQRKGGIPSWASLC